MKGPDFRPVILSAWLRVWRWFHPARRKWVPRSLWWRLRPTIPVYVHNSPVLNQQSFRARNDDGSESAATWIAAVNTNWTQAVDANFRIRFLVQETNGGSSNNASPQLQYNLNSGGWNNVTASSTVVRSSASTQFADDDNTTQQVGSGTFITPNSGMDEDNGLAGENSDIDFAGNDEVEVEYCVQIRSADVADADTIQLRVIDGATAARQLPRTPRR